MDRKRSEARSDTVRESIGAELKGVEKYCASREKGEDLGERA